MLSQTFISDNTPLTERAFAVPRKQSPGESRILSVDTLRGFAIAVLLIATPLVAALKETPPSTVRDTLIRQLSHVKGEGTSLFDVGWPAFLVIAGISLNFALSGQLQQGKSKLSVFMNLLQKCLLFLPFAFFVHGGFSIPWAKVFFADVLFIYTAVLFAAGTIQLLLGTRGTFALFVILMIGFSIGTVWGTYSAFGSFQQKPGASLDDLIQKYLGSKLAMKYAWYFPRQLMSCLAGLLLAKIYQGNLAPQSRVWWLGGVGLSSLCTACVMANWIQISKRLWTSSYVLFTLGVTCLFLAALYQLIEVWGIRAFTMPWIVFGKNALLAYAAHELVPFDQYAQRAVGYVFEPTLGAYNPVLLALVQFVLCWLVFYELYRRKIFIRVG